MNSTLLRQVGATLVVLLTLAATMALPAAAAGTGTITLHSRLCPAGQPTTDIFNDCHSHLPTLPTTYSLDGGAAKAVGANGNLTFASVTAVKHTIAQQDGVPLDFAHLRVFCSDQTAGSVAKEIKVAVNAFTVLAVAGDTIVCDVYTVPENASGLPTTGTITLHSRVCPAGQPTTSIFTDCHSHLPAQTTSYSIDGGAAKKVGKDGNVSFTKLGAGVHHFAQVDGAPLDAAYLRVFCSDVTAQSQAKEVAVKVQKFSVSAIAGDVVICDVYTIAENASGKPTTGTITLHSRVCPAGQPTANIFTDCHSHLPTQATSYSLDGGGAKMVDAKGNVTFTAVSAGKHTVAQQEGAPLDAAHLRVFCSDVTVGSDPLEAIVKVNAFTVNAVAGDQIVCDVYTIGENLSGQ